MARKTNALKNLKANTVKAEIRKDTGAPGKDVDAAHNLKEYSDYAKRVKGWGTRSAYYDNRTGKATTGRNNGDVDFLAREPVTPAMKKADKTASKLDKSDARKMANKLNKKCK